MYALRIFRKNQGFTAAAIVALGLYGVMNCNVAQRSREIGLRMGWSNAQQRARHGVRQALAMTCLGPAIGAMLGGGFAAGFVFGASARQPETICAIAAISSLWRL